MAPIPTRAINPARQLTAIRSVLSAASGSVNRGVLDCVVPLQPSPASQVYTVRFVYRHGARPRATVIDPELILHPDADSLPHVYPEGDLCLYSHGEWRHDMFLSTTVVPWAAEWLLHYELWLITGHWHGGGHV